MKPLQQAYANLPAYLHYSFYLPSSFYLRKYALSATQELVETAIYSFACLSLPFLLGHEQLVVGAAVNCALVLSALNLRGGKLLPAIMLPSVAACSAGLLFGVGSTALLYMVPFIWIANAIFVLSVKELTLLRGLNSAIAVAAGSVAKSAFLFSSAAVLNYFGLVPPVFLAAMGIFQLATALLGGSAALAVQAGKQKLGY